MNKQMKKMLEQAQKMQQGLARIQEELAEARIEGTSGGGMVKATTNGKAELIALSISPEVVDPDDSEMLEDMVLAAVRDAVEKSRKLSETKMQELGLPPGMTGGLT